MFWNTRNKFQIGFSLPKISELNRYIHFYFWRFILEHLISILYHRDSYIFQTLWSVKIYSGTSFFSLISQIYLKLQHYLSWKMSVWCNVFSQNFQMSLKPPSTSQEEDSSLDGYDPGQETTARSSPYHLSDGALSGHTEEHCTWDRQLEYILACCSFVNGIDTFLWFPKMAATYGGGITWLMDC